jgi:hypothetical protein
MHINANKEDETIIIIHKTGQNKTFFMFIYSQIDIILY